MILIIGIFLQVMRFVGACIRIEQKSYCIQFYFASIAQDPDRRYTYCLDYHHSMTILPGNPEQERRHTAKESRGSWRTATGFIYPGKKTMIESNKHQMKPDHARRDELETVIL